MENRMGRDHSGLVQVHNMFANTVVAQVSSTDVFEAYGHMKTFLFCFVF